MNPLLCPAPADTAAPRTRWNAMAKKALTAMAVVCLTVIVLGQLLFAAYVAVFYLGSVVSGQIERWNQVLPKGYDPTDPLGNAVLGVHFLLAVLFLLGGALQLWPALRRHVPALHRWNGRLYLMLASLLAVGGLWLVWVRGGVVGDLSQHIAISINAVLILGCAVMAWRGARKRHFADHRRWALRLFVVASGVWFFRVGLMAWLAVHQRPAGFDPETFQGSFLTALAIGVYVLLPLGVLQLYFAASDRGNTLARLGGTAVMAGVTGVILLGVFAAAMGLWLPRLQSGAVMGG